MLKLFVTGLLAFVPGAAVVAPSGAQPPTHSKPSAPAAWCAPETAALTSDVCHVDFNTEGRRTLIVFLHGLVPKHEPWQWTQQRAILREAKQFHFAAIMPQGQPVGVNGSGGYAWPGTNGGAPDVEQDLIAKWTEARRLLEARAGRPFDEVFVVGFSSGAYFATSLALRDRLKADGYVILAGGAPAQPAAESHRAPIFIGVSSQDRATAPNARALGQTLAARAWPYRVDEEPVGHMISDLHVAHALTYLRAAVDKDTALTPTGRR